VRRLGDDGGGRRREGGGMEQSDGAAVAVADQDGTVDPGRM
jgi:hypothetical protein